MSISTSANFSASVNVSKTMTDYLFNNLGPAVNPVAYKNYLQRRREDNPNFFKVKPAVRDNVTGVITGHVVGSYLLKIEGGAPSYISYSTNSCKGGDIVKTHSRSKGGVGTIRPDGTEVLLYTNIKTPHKGIDKGAAWNLGTSKKSRNKAANRARLSARIFTANRADRLGASRTASNGIGTGFNSRNTFSPYAKAYTASGTKQFVRVYRCEAEPLATPLVLKTVEYPTFKPVETSYQRKLSRRWAEARKDYLALRRQVNRQAFTLEAVLTLLDRVKVARTTSKATTHNAVSLADTVTCALFFTGDWSIRFATVFEDCYAESLMAQFMPVEEVIDEDTVLSIHESLFGSTTPNGSASVDEEKLAETLESHAELLEESRSNWGCDLSMALRRTSNPRIKTMRSTTKNRANKKENQNSNNGMTVALETAKATWLTASKVRSKSNVEQRISYATKLYNRKGFDASESTYSGYVAKLYGMGQLEIDSLVSEDLQAEIVSLLEEDIKAYEIAEQLEITTLEAYAVYHHHNQKPMSTSRRSTARRSTTSKATSRSTNRTTKRVERQTKETTSRRRVGRVGLFKLYDDEKLVVDAPIDANEVLTSLSIDYDNLFTLSSSDKEFSEEDKYVMAIVPFRANCATCNVNLHTNVIPDNKKNKYEEYMFSDDNRNCKEIPVGNTPSAEYKANANDEDGKFRNKSPLTFRPGRVFTNMLGKSGRTYLKWGDACYTNFTGLDDLFGSRVSNYILFNSKVEGKSDLTDRQAGSKSVGETAAEVRAVLREAILGADVTEYDKEFLAEHGNSVEVSTSLNDAVDFGDPAPSLEGEVGDRHYMLVFARVEQVLDERKFNEDKVSGQYRFLCDYVSGWYVPASNLSNVCDLERLSSRNEYFTLLGDPIFAETAKEDTKEAKQSSSRRRRKPSRTVATQESETVEAQVVATEESETTEAQVVEAQVVETQVVEAEESETVETQEDKVYKEVATYSHELKNLYEYMHNPVEVNRSETYWTVEEVLKGFSVRASKAAKVESLSVLYPDVAEERLDELISVTDKGAKWSKAQRVADAIRYYLYGHLSEGGKNLSVDPSAMPLLDYTWQFSDIEDIVAIIHNMMARDKGARKRHSRKASSISDAIRLENNHLIIDGQLAFTFEDDVVYDYRGRAFSNTLVMTKEEDDKGKKTGKTDIVLANSFSNFMYFFYMAYVPLLANWKGNSGIFSNTFENLKSVLDGCGHLFKMTTDKVSDQNGGALHGLTSTYSPLLYSDFSPLKTVKDKKSNLILKTWFSLGSKSAKRLIKHYTNSNVSNIASEFSDMMSGGLSSNGDSDLGSLIKDSMTAAHSKYGLDFHFTKGQFVRGTLGHVNLAMVKRFCPELFVALRNHLGKDITAKKVIANTIKASKGLKRVMLSLAQAATVVNEQEAGWRLYDQSKAVYGALVKTILGPTIVCAPGMSAWIGAEEDMPIALVNKRVKFVRDNYELDEEGNVFDFTASTLVGANVIEWTTVEKEDGWNYVTPSKSIYMVGNGKERICDIVGGEALYHQHTLEGELICIRWREQISIDNKESELIIEYTVQTVEHHGKMRSIGKGQYFKTDKSLIHNELNNVDIDGDLFLMQDVIKSDTIYSWLMVAANTIFHNCGKSEDNDYLDMVQEVIKINRKVVGNPNLINNKPQLVIEPAAVAAGLYDNLQKMFVDKFGKTIWVKWEQAQTMTDIVFSLYSNKVKAGAWVTASDVNDFPEIMTWADGRDVVIFHENEAITSKTNILAFILEDGKAVAYAQRGCVLGGTSDLPLYNVELFESSTVKESVSSSTGLIAYIKALTAVVGKQDQVLNEQKSMLDDGLTSVMSAKMLAAAVDGNNLTSLNNGNEIVDSHLSVLPIKDKGANLVFNESSQYDDVYNELMDNLAEVGIDVDNINVYEKGFFRKLAYAARNIVFTFNTGGNAEAGIEADKTALWLPALYSLSKLTSKSDENRDFISMFVFDVLVPLIEGKPTKTKLLIQVRGILEGFVSSKNTIKYMNGRRCAGGKRIALPCIPCGETWVLFSQDTNSFYQELIRAGIPVDNFEAVAKGIVVNGNRAPMPAGPVSRIRLVMPEEVNGVIRQRLVAFEGEAEPTQYLLHELSPVQVGVDVMSVNLDGGDYDGDNHYLTLLESLTLDDITTFERCWELRTKAIGIDMFSADCGTYAADHYGIKTWAKASLTLTNLKGAIVKSALKDAKEYVSYNGKAFELQTKAVGVMYGVYMMGETIISLVNEAKAAGVDYPSSLEELTGPESSYFVLVLAEIYEIMLGGYDSAPYQLYLDYLEPMLMNEDYISPADIKERYKEISNAELDTDELHIYNIRQLLKDMGASSGQAHIVYTIFNIVADALAVNKNKKAPYDFIKDEETGEMIADENNLNLNNFIYLAVVTFELSRGRFEGFSGVLRDKGNSKKAKGHRYALTQSINFLNSLKESNEGMAFVDNSVTLYGFNKVCRHLYDELQESKATNISWYQDEFDYFTDILGTVDVVTADEEEIELDLSFLSPITVVEPSKPSKSTKEKETTDTEPTQVAKSAKKVKAKPTVEDSAPISAPIEEEEIEIATPIKKAKKPNKVETTPSAPAEEVSAPISAPVEEEDIEIASPIKKAFRPVFSYVTNSEPKVEDGVDESIVDPIKPAVKPSYRKGITKQEIVVELATLLTDSGELTAEELLDKLRNIADSKLEEQSAEPVAEPKEEVQVIKKVQKVTKQDTASVKTEKTKPSIKAELNESMDKYEGPIGPSDVEVSAPMSAPIEEENIPTASKIPSKEELKKAKGNLVKSEAPKKARQIISKPALNIDEQEVVNDEKSLTKMEEDDFRHNLNCQLKSKGAEKKLIDKINSLTVEQIILVKEVLSGKDVALTGEGGCGKSYTVDVLRDIYSFLKWNFVVVGSTGTSVMNVEGDGTFNSLFNLGLGFNRSDKGYVSELEDYRSLVSKARISPIIVGAKNRPGKTRPVLVILDEVSMVDTRMLNVVQDAAEKEDIKLHWLVVGDPLQFLPVKGSLFFKDTKVSHEDETYVQDSLLSRLGFTIINLTQNIRAQGDVELVSALNEMRLGKKINSIFRQRFRSSSSLSEDNKLDMVHMYFNNNLVKKHNEKMTNKMIEDGAKSKKYVAKVKTFSGKSGWHLKNSKGFDDTTIFDPIGLEMTICEGMPVMIRMNLKNADGSLKAANGTMGKVTKLMEDAVNIQLKSGEIIRVDSCPLHAPTDRKGKPIGEFKQLPLHPAFAITMHKSQGITFDQPVMVHAYQMSNKGEIKPISRYSPNSLYVACSRVTKREWLHFATDLNHLDIEVSEASMWSMLKSSYHTDKEALSWVNAITSVS